jgi:DNA replication protein DnaC
MQNLSRASPSNRAERDARRAKIEQEQKESQAREKRGQQIEAWKVSGVPDRHRGRQVGELKTHAKWAAAFDAACQVVDRGGILALVGERGSGKTQCGVELVRRYCLRRRACRYVRVRDIGLNIRASYDAAQHLSEAEVIAEFTRPRLLVVDEVQERTTTDFAKETLTYILDCRYGVRLPTVLIGNATEDGFKKIVGPAIVDRLREGGGVIVFSWPSFRGRQGGES